MMGAVQPNSEMFEMTRKSVESLLAATKAMETMAVRAVAATELMAQFATALRELDERIKNLEEEG